VTADINKLISRNITDVTMHFSDTDDALANAVRQTTATTEHAVDDA